MLVAPSHPATDVGKWEAAVSNTAVREMRLKAFAKSSLTSTLPCTDRLRKVQARTVWMAISAPDLTPTPSWVGQSMRRASSCAVCIKHFAVGRRRTSPMAMGRTPPFGFGTATRPAPARTGATAGQARPCASRFTSCVRCSTVLWAMPGGPASRRCCTRSPEGPGAVSAGKLCKALATQSSGSSSASGREAGSEVGVGGTGCTGVSVFLAELCLQ